MKPGIDTAFYRDTTLASINGLADYYDDMESQLDSLKIVERNKIHANIKNTGLNTRDAISELDLAMQDYEAKYEMLFTNFFRYSFVVLLFLVLEERLHNLCHCVNYVKGISSSPPNPRQKIIQSYRHYLQEVGVSITTELWDNINDLNLVRNCIVHASGNVKRSRHESRLIDLSLQGIGILISGPIHIGEPLPLYLEDNMLMLKPEYCKLAISQTAQLFEKLCDAVPLHRIDWQLWSNPDNE